MWPAGPGRPGRARGATPDEGGQTSIEYVGVLLLTGVVLAALTVGTSGAVLRRGLDAALCRLLDQNCRAHRVADEPDTPCVTRLTTHAGRGDLIVAVGLSRELGYDIREFSDGSVEVTYRRLHEGGGGVGVGAQIEAYWADRTYREGALAYALARLAVADGTVWRFEGPDAATHADEWVRWHAVDTAVADAMIGRDSNVGRAYGAAHRAVRSVAEWAGVAGRPPAAPVSTTVFREGGVRLAAAGTGGLAVGSASGRADADASAERVLGYERNADGTTVVYLRADTSLVGDGTVESGSIAEEADGQAGWSEQGVVAVTVGRDLRPRSARLTLYRLDGAGAQFSLVTDPADVLGDGLFRGALDPAAREKPSLYQLDIALDLTDPQQAEAFDDFLLVAGSTLLPEARSPRPDAGLETLIERGETSVIEYREREDEYGARVSGAALARVTGGVKYTQSQMDVANAHYYDRRTGVYAPWTRCTS